MSLTPLDTLYRGYRFRSRLEARWALFFDELGIKWEYEPAAYRLGSGSYLPDFFLPDDNSFVEVKHEGMRSLSKYYCDDLPSDSDSYLPYHGPREAECWPREQRLARELSVSTGCDVYVVYGDPMFSETFMEFNPDRGYQHKYLSCWSPIERVWEDIPHDQEIINPDYGRSEDPIELAQQRARQARFEHGENDGHRTSKTVKQLFESRSSIQDFVADWDTCPDLVVIGARRYRPSDFSEDVIKMKRQYPDIYPEVT